MVLNYNYNIYSKIQIIKIIHTIYHFYVNNYVYNVSLT